MGRGVFASKDLLKGELIAVEKALALEYQYKNLIGSSKEEYKPIVLGCQYIP